jgi:hypothetical protein
MSPDEKPTSQIVDSLGAVVLAADEVLLVVLDEVVLLIAGDAVVPLLVPVDPVAPDGM